MIFLVGVASIVAFAISLILELAGVHKGNFNYHVFEVVGFLLLSVYIVAGGGSLPWKRNS